MASATARDHLGEYAFNAPVYAAASGILKAGGGSRILCVHAAW
jgi:hypothetical protein